MASPSALARRTTLHLCLTPIIPRQIELLGLLTSSRLLSGERHLVRSLTGTSFWYAKPKARANELSV